MSDVNYQCTIVKINNLHPLEGLDRLQGTVIFGNQVLVGKEVQIGELGLYFPPESQIGESFCILNNLYRDSTLNSDSSKKGMFETNKRVRVIKLKGNPSAGFWCPIDFLEEQFGSDLPKEGDSFNMWKDIEICKKYIPKGNSRGQNNTKEASKKWSRIIKEFFPEHIDTEHLFKNLHKVRTGDKVILTWKLHGTSFRVGNVPVKRILSLLERVSRFFGAKIQETEYTHLNGSRKVIKDPQNLNQKHYYEKDLWSEIGSSYFKDKLHMGEMVFGEAIGYVPNGTEPIQKGFTYGCKPGQCEIYVYRITNNGIDLSWEALKERCVELGVKYVPEITTLIMDMDESEFEAYIKEELLEKDCHLDASHPEEGIVCRIEGLYPQFYKAKSFRFLQKETEALDKEEVDIETLQS